MKTEPFVIERVYNAPIEKVWKAITDKDQMKQWYFDIPAFNPEPGCEFSFSASNEGRIYIHLCKITEVVKGRKIAYSWTYKDTPGHSVVTWELFPEGDKTKLRLTHEGIETFPQDKPDYAKENFVMGWTHIVGTSLMKFLEGQHQPAEATSGNG
jgi:uncharacterized protein YndB with AHSA1/START domain